MLCTVADIPLFSLIFVTDDFVVFLLCVSGYVNNSWPWAST